MIILFLAAGLSTSNLIARAVIAIIVFPAHLRRIAMEENMLAEGPGPEYLDYMIEVNGGKK